MNQTMKQTKNHRIRSALRKHDSLGVLPANIKMMKPAKYMYSAHRVIIMTEQDDVDDVARIARCYRMAELVTQVGGFTDMPPSEAIARLDDKSVGVTTLCVHSPTLRRDPAAYKQLMDRIERDEYKGSCIRHYIPPAP